MQIDLTLLLLCLCNLTYIHLAATLFMRLLLHLMLLCSQHAYASTHFVLAPARFGEKLHRVLISKCMHAGSKFTCLFWQVRKMCCLGLLSVDMQVSSLTIALRNKIMCADRNTAIFSQILGNVKLIALNWLGLCYRFFICLSVFQMKS